MTASPNGVDRDKPKCGGARRGEGAGLTCTRPAGWGTDHAGVGRCKLHGGATRNHSVAAQRTLAEQAMRTYGIRRKLPVPVALLDEFEWSLGHVAWLRDIVATLEPEALVWGKTEEHEKLAGEFPGVDTRFLAAPSVWLKLYHDERRMMLDLGKTIETLNLENRKQALAEYLGVNFAAVLQAVFADPEIGASDAQRQVLPGVLARHVAAIAGGAV